MSEPIIYGTNWAVVDTTSSDQSVYVDWSIYDLTGVEDSGKPLYSLMMETGSSGDYTDDITKAKPWASITIKWDGCSHLYLNDRGYYSIGGYSEWEQWNELIKDLFLRSAKKMKVKGISIMETEFPTHSN